MAQLPDGDPAPADGALPASAAEGAADRDFGIYLHVPYCRVRCGYCDFNTYTASELRGTSQDSYIDQALTELSLAHTVLADLGAVRPVSTVFFGGGTPTILPAEDLVRALAAMRETFGFVDGAEVTTEANPDSIDAEGLLALAEGGFTRVSFGMQSAESHVLRTLDRTHDPARVPQVVEWAKQVGLEVSIDLIYGTPGESLADWQRSLEEAISYDTDHISAYSLIVEDGTAMARNIRAGRVPEIDEDLQADMYEVADARLAEAGFEWYEVSNWARNGRVSRHNLSYWRGADWWGIGPGAHSHVGGVRWWNVKHPAAYADRLRNGTSPALAREVLDAETRWSERVLLETRIRDGFDIELLKPAGRAQVAGLIASELIDAKAALSGRVVPTLRGRLLADRVARVLSEPS